MDPEIISAFQGIFDKFLYPPPDLIQIREVRVYHRWTLDKKWKERWRAGDMSFLHLGSDRDAGTFLGHDYGEILHGAN